MFYAVTCTPRCRSDGKSSVVFSGRTTKVSYPAEPTRGQETSDHGKEHETLRLQGLPLCPRKKRAALLNSLEIGRKEWRWKAAIHVSYYNCYKSGEIKMIKITSMQL